MDRISDLSIALGGRLRRWLEIYTDTDPDVVAGFRAKQIGAIMKVAPLSLLANVAIVGVLLHIQRSDPQHRLLLYVWTGIMAVTLGLGFRGWFRGRSRPAPIRVSPRAVNAAVRNAVFLAMSWSVIPIFFFSREQPDQAIAVASICTGTILGGAFALATVPLAATGYVVILTAGCLVGLVTDGAARNLDIIVLLLVYSTIIMATVSVSSKTFGARLMAEADAERQKQLVGLLLKDFETNATDWLWESDQAGRLRHVSPRLVELLNRPESDLIGRNLVDLLLELQPSGEVAARDSMAELSQCLSVAAPFREISISVELDGRRMWWMLTAKPLFDRHEHHVGWRGVGSDVSERRRSLDELSRLANSDSLTGLANRHALERLITSLTADDPTSMRRPFAILCFDLDDFKSINDSLGHAAGDEVLRAVAARLQTEVRPADMLARLGGDEFALVAMNVANEREVDEVAQRMLGALGANCEVGGRDLRVTTSIGIALYPRDGTDRQELLKHSDMALYAAKAAGRNTWRFFDPQLEESIRQKHSLQSDMQRALHNGEFEVHFQPQVCLSTGIVRGFEALARWKHPTKGVISPAQFIPVAEETGLIVQLGSMILHQACLVAARWPGVAHVAVNVSPVQFSRGELMTSVRSALQESGLQPTRLELEVTESVLMDDHEAALRTIQSVRDLGVGVALDDFGTGFSSLAYLRDFPLTKLKIDRSFVTSIGGDLGKLAIVRSVLELAKALRLEVVAEGIESSKELRALRSLGCGQGQGYLFAPPMTEAALEQYVALQWAAHGDQGCPSVAPPGQTQVG